MNKLQMLLWLIKNNKDLQIILLLALIFDLLSFYRFIGVL